MDLASELAIYISNDQEENPFKWKWAESNLRSEHIDSIQKKGKWHDNLGAARMPIEISVILSG